jgi:hypothetical protein
MSEAAMTKLSELKAKVRELANSRRLSRAETHAMTLRMAKADKAGARKLHREVLTEDLAAALRLLDRDVDDADKFIADVRMALQQATANGDLVVMLNAKQHLTGKKMRRAARFLAAITRELETTMSP